MSKSSIDAPAKVNLGLEVLGRRADGFHEIRSVLAMISLRDTLAFDEGGSSEDVVHIHSEVGEIPSGPNLVCSALGALREAGIEIPPQIVSIQKRIPIAAGLGGASSDAAATLRHFGARASAPKTQLMSMAASLGSDVPFFLGHPFALVSGRGEILTALPQPSNGNWVVTVTPHLRIPAKTATMYATIKSAWWSSGDRVESFAAGFPCLSEDVPANIFSGALFSLFPELADTRDVLTNIGFTAVHVTGAGPTMYGVCGSRSEAGELARCVRVHVPTACVRASQLGYAPIAPPLASEPLTP